MKSYAIVIKNNAMADEAFLKLEESSKRVGNKFKTLRYDAVTKPTTWAQMAWNYPWEGQQMDISSGLLKSAYPTAVRDKRIGCAESHYNLWCQCVDDGESYLIQEQDSVWKRKLDTSLANHLKFDIIGINDPAYSTRRANVYHNAVQSIQDEVSRAPKIDEDNIPQGIAGNSAYIISPHGAKKMITLVFEYGLWPNDAIMCRQLVARLGQSKTYYTGVQGLPSTTST